MVRGILQQVLHHPTEYTAEMAMRQVALHMIKHPNHFYQYVEEDLLKARESYESFCVNVFRCNVWGDNLIAAAFGDMWNIAVSIISPVAKKPFHLFHTKSQPDVVLVCNGGNYLKNGGSTHYNGTRSTDPEFRKPGSDLINPTLQQDMMAKLTPTVLKDKETAKQLALNEYLKDERQASLDLLRTVCKGIRRLDDKIATLIEQSDDLRNQKKFLVYKMEKLGIKTDQIDMYMQELGERPFCRTLEPEKEDEEENRKRQLEEDKEESEGKRAKIMPTVEGHENLDFLSPGKKATADQEEHDNKLKEQQKELIRSHELTIQQQEESLIKQQRTIKLQQEIIDAMKQQQPTRAQEVKCSSLSGVVPGTSEEGNVFPGQSFKTGGYGTIDNYLKPDALSFLHRAKQETPNIQEDDVVISQEIPEVSTSRINVPVLPSQLQISEREQQEPAIEKNVYLPKQVPESQNLILVPARMKKTTTLRASTRPVPEELQDDRLHYCKKCEAKYTTRDELNRHVAKNCQVKEPEFFCDQCDASFFWPNTFREHYYKEHIKEFLYHCQKCGKGFHWKSRIPRHNKKCPNRDGPDQYEGRLPYDKKVEEKFQRKKAVPVDLDDLQENDREPLPEPPLQQQEPKDLLQPSVNPSIQNIEPSNQATPQLVGEEDLELEKNPLGPILQTPSIDPSGAAEQTPSTEPSAPVQPLNPDDVLNMLSEGRLPNIAGEIQGVEDEDEDEDTKPVILDVENKF